MGKSIRSGGSFCQVPRWRMDFSIACLTKLKLLQSSRACVAKVNRINLHYRLHGKGEPLILIARWGIDVRHYSLRSEIVTLIRLCQFRNGYSVSASIERITKNKSSRRTIFLRFIVPTFSRASRSRPCKICHPPFGRSEPLCLGTEFQYVCAC